MNSEEKLKVLRGWVPWEGDWIRLEERIAREQDRHSMLAKGFVKFLGEWITIEDKINRLGEAAHKKSLRGGGQSKPTMRETYEGSARKRTPRSALRDNGPRLEPNIQDSDTEPEIMLGALDELSRRKRIPKDIRNRPPKLKETRKRNTHKNRLR